MKISGDKLRQALSVYLVMGLQEVQGRDPVTLAKEALIGGVTMIQLREKKKEAKEIIKIGSAIRELCAEYRVPFIVNDRVDIAVILEADGVHLGRDDIPPAQARKLLRPDQIIGVSAGDRIEAELALHEGGDYLGVGSIFATSTKSDAGPPVGLKWVKEARDLSPGIPIVGIGGINEDNAMGVIQAGADGVAVVSAIVHKERPTEAAQRLVNTIQKAKLDILGHSL